MSETANRVAEVARHVAENPKIATTVAGSTLATSAATVLDKLPGVIGVVASILGAIVSVLVIRAQIELSRTRASTKALNDEKLRLEIAELKAREADRKAAAAMSPGRRCDDHEGP